jgi:diguanylate cyclase
MTNNNLDELDCDYAAFIGERAVSLMSRLRIPQTPANYSIWFNYCQGVSPSLKKAIDALFENDADFDAVTRAALISNFGNGETAAASNGVTERLGSLMQDAQGLLQTAIVDNRTQILAMGQVANEIGAEADPQTIIESLVAELSKSVSRASQLEKNFVHASQELEMIRVSLDEAETRARTDGLTGLPNRLALDDFSHSAQMAAFENGSPLSILLMDIDYFKRFNDQYGHGVGDEVLRLIAKLLRERVRKQDLPVRYGGEELMAVLPGSDLQACVALGESIRKSVSECKITRRSTGEALQGITVSIGVAQWRLGESMPDLIDRCDRALYKAKAAGRNRIVMDAESEFRQRIPLVVAAGR